MQPETQLNQSKLPSSIVDVHGIKKYKTPWMKKAVFGILLDFFFIFQDIPDGQQRWAGDFPRGVTEAPPSGTTHCNGGVRVPVHQLFFLSPER